MYKLLGNDFTGMPLQGIKRLSDNAWIPKEPDNTDYQQFLAWVAEGNTPTPADEPTA